MSENQTTSLDLHSYLCGPSTKTINSLDWAEASEMENMKRRRALMVQELLIQVV